MHAGSIVQLTQLPAATGSPQFARQSSVPVAGELPGLKAIAGHKMASELNLQAAAKAENLAKQAIKHYMEACNPIVASDTQKYLRKLIGVAERQANALDERAALRSNVFK